MYLFLLCLLLSFIISIICYFSVDVLCYMQRVESMINSFVITFLLTISFSFFISFPISQESIVTVASIDKFPLIELNPKSYATITNRGTNFVYKERNAACSKLIEKITFSELKEGEAPYVSIKNLDSSQTHWCFFTAHSYQYTLYVDKKHITVDFKTP